MMYVFWQLVKRDLTIFLYDFPRHFINSFIWLISTAVVSNYVMSAMGIQTGYGIFILVGSLCSLSLFRSVHSIPVLLGDIEGEGAISYYLTLPMKQWMVFARYAMSFALTGAIVSLAITAASKVVLWNMFVLDNLSIIKYLVIFVVLHIFVGFFGVLITAYTPGMRYIENVWTRVIFPLWFLGGYQYTWATLFKQLPWLAYVNLFNPMTYVFEAFRGAFLGQEGYLNFWLCCGMILLFAALSAFIGIRKFMCRLDCVG